MARPLRDRGLLPREAAGETAAIPRLDLPTPRSSRFYITSCGNARQDILLVDPDRELFLDTLADTVNRFGRICRAYCLMSNHCHLLVEAPEANLSRGMRHLNGVCTRRSTPGASPCETPHHRVLVAIAGASTGSGCEVRGDSLERWGTLDLRRAVKPEIDAAHLRDYCVLTPRR